MANTADKTPYLRDVEKALAADAPDWVKARRAAAAQRFEARDLPHSKQEDWRFTNIAPITRNALPTYFDAESAKHVEAEQFAHVHYDGVGATLVFVDGFYAAHLSNLDSELGITVGTLGEALASNGKSVEPYLDIDVAEVGNAFTALNGALLTDGPFVHIEKNTVAEKPVHLVWVSTEKGARAHHPRILITAGENSQAEIVESFVDVSVNGGYLNNVVGEYVLEAGANIHVYKVIEEGKGYHLATQRVRQQRDSHYTSHVFNLSGAIARNEISILLDGEGAGCSLHGLYLTKGDELVDNRQEITHAKPNCTSWIGYKGVLDGESKAVYTGKIYVDRIAQKTDSNQLNQNVLLSDKAQIDTKPQLEIYADDVKCTHGATIGQFSDELVYYFQTRGIGPDTARAMLTYGFADEVVDEVNFEGLKSRLDTIVFDRYSPKKHKEQR